MNPVYYNALQTVQGQAKTTEVHGKWVNYFNNGWNLIDTTITLEDGVFVMNKAPFTVEIPARSTGTAKFTATNQWDVFSKTRISDGPITQTITAVGVNDVRGKIASFDDQGINNAIIYPDAYPNGDLIYYIKHGRSPSLQKLIRFKSKPATDQLYTFTLGFDTAVQMLIDSQEYDGRKLDTTKGVGFRVSDKRGIAIKRPQIWSNTKRSNVRVSLEVVDDQLILVKNIPASFFADTRLPVYTDTESTFFPDPDAETNTVDGRVFRNNQDETFNDLRTGAGTGAEPSAPSGVGINIHSTTTTDQFKEIYRSVFLYDTSPLGSDTIDSSTMDVYVQNHGTDLGDLNAVIVSSSPASNTDLVAADYNIANWGSTDFCTPFAFSTLSNGSYKSVSLNAAGLAAIDGSGITKLGYRTEEDVDNNAPTWSSNVQSFWAQRWADQSGTSTDPKLVVTHSPAATATTPQRMTLLGVS